MQTDHNYAVISDIHGNLLALEAVLQDISRRGIEYISNLGDCIYGPLEPMETADLLMDLHLPTVSGNEDRIIVESSGVLPENQTLRFLQKSLQPRHIKWLESLPHIATVWDHFTLFHGTPSRDNEYLIRKVESHGVVQRTELEVSSLLQGVSTPVVLCGHDHVPAIFRMGDVLIINPGSVGLQAYSDSHPYSHSMQTGSPLARYAIVTKKPEIWDAEIVEVEYDWEAAAVKASRNGRDDWAKWLRTGKV